MSGVVEAHRVAALLARARLDRKQLTSLPAELTPRSEEGGYRIQEELNGCLAAAGLGQPGGYKVGLVSASIRAVLGGHEVLGVDSPVYGGIASNRIYRRRAEVAFGDFIRPYVEGEIAVRLGGDLENAGRTFTADDVAAHVSECFAAIELVDWRMQYFDFAPPLAPLMIADGGSNWGCVLGAPVRDWRALELPRLRGAMTVDGREIGGGTGADLQGNPLNVLAWLANKIALRGRRLRGGDIVLLGSVTPSYGKFERGAEVVVTWDALGSVSAQFN